MNRIEMNKCMQSQLIIATRKKHEHENETEKEK